MGDALRHLQAAMDGAEEDTLKGIDLILGTPALRAAVSPAVLDDYIRFAQCYYTAVSPVFNPLLAILRGHGYPLPDLYP